MKIDTSTILHELDGKELVVDGKPVLLKTVLINALMHQSQEFMPTAEQSMRAYILGTLLSTEKEVELNSEDIVYIKARILKISGPLIYGQIAQILEGKTEN